MFKKTFGYDLNRMMENINWLKLIASNIFICIYICYF